MARQGRAAPTDEQAERVMEPFRDFPRVQHANPCGRELDGERDPVQPPADLRHRARVRFGKGEGRERIGRTVDEQPHGFRCLQRLDRCLRRGEREGRHQPRHLARHTERLAARREDPQSRAAAEELVRERGRRTDHVLAIVEDQKGLPVREALEEHFGRRPPGRFPEAERGRDRPRHERLVHDRAELDPRELPGLVFGRQPGELDRQPRLAAAAGARQRQEPVRREELAHGADLPLPTHEFRERDGKARTGQLDCRGCRVHWTPHRGTLRAPPRKEERSRCGG